MNGGSQKILCNIARCAFEVINRLLSRDQLLAREMRSSETQSHQIYREECITVEMAAELRERFPKHVEIILFTPREETRTGADWYWRFEKAGGAIHARVQAKRVQRTKFGQPDCHGHIDVDRAQVNRLVEETERACAEHEELVGLQAWLATYARSRATPPCGQADLMCCIRHRHAGVCADGGPSLWIAQASAFLKGSETKKRMQIKNIVEESVRLDCILPCIDQQDGDGPGAKGFALQTTLRPFHECITVIGNDPALRSGFEGALRIHIDGVAPP